MNITPIQTLQLYLEGEGLFGDWQAPDETTQPAPELQTRILKEADIDNNKRILLIKSISNTGTRYVSEPVFLFSIMGKVGESEIYAETYANLIYAALLDFDHADCVISIDPLSPVNGAYLMESGRPVFDCEFTTKVDSGHFGAGTT